ncbi:MULTISPECIES: 2-hydroxyacid dehydrogenase family protein [Peptoniphilus]|jgi:D-isomer specific 2-hydroxyacid dehydrogenase family protein|uniref:2-hydroxyacid dehydrogenase family protein n=1 Tax=Peptoniphilus TaxID=162289 RepID=UPI0002882918|nr:MULTISPECIES: 2-hydroxyacid dehydrogenase family protein [Peptoniphilus]MDU1044162.1 2-hydroxyacid dehydrogenase family protein [Peptoniphilus rhinitidis]MDU1955425.1 2-hydroxyacid dehydrogenase family protein [Peptoniphilus lacydonensis]MDU2110728.1 2-hydroxyacid dehydrogenase family protein [Peptoniphilus lacydonensis]MDU3750636.1 2-hydroxyacid dehydrogenase family protein [Peptoniphilus rhinitidis]MDU5275761.1 2-hydroxyacid dehydrogenase family protein [Peptoniphilus lacydonensis]
MKLLITSNIPEDIYNELNKNFDITYHNSNIPLTREEIIEKIKGKDALLCPLSDKIDKDVIDASDNLKIIANYGAGFDNIDINYAREKGIVVTNAPAPASAISTAELTFGLMLASARRIVSGDKVTREGKFYGWRPTFYLGSELKDKTLGIIGLGNIGKNLAKRAKAFEMNVIYYSRTRKEDFEKEFVLKYMEKDDVIKNSDFLSLHTAFVPELRHMISKKELEMMKKSAILINASRGPIVDEDALADALIENKIAGAALDVYEKEPKVNEKLLALDNVILAPHLGNATFEARLEMGKNAKDNLIDFKNGKTPKNKVN